MGKELNSYKISWPYIRIDKSKGKNLIYFVLTDDFKYVKIGKTNNIKRRMSELKTSSFNNLILIGLTNKMPEKFYHNKFNSDKIKKGGQEWFIYSERMENYLKNEL